MLLITGIATWGALFATVFDPKGVLGWILSFFVVPAYALLALLGAIPILVLRKQTLTTDPPRSPSLLGQLALLRQPATQMISLYYLAGGGILLVSYLSCASYVSQDARLFPLFFHEGRDAQQLNERFLFLLLQQISLVFAATVYHVASHKSRVVFDLQSHLSIPDRLKATASRRVQPLLLATAAFTGGFYLIYCVLLKSFLCHLVRNYAGNWARPYLYSLLKKNATLSLSLPLRAFASTLFTLSVWEMAHVCFEVYATQPMIVSHFAPKANQCLRSGLASESPYFQSFAFLELATLSAEDATRRKSIFVDIKTEGGGGGAWHDLSRECLKLIGTELQRAKGRGVLPQPPPEPTPAPPPVRPSTPSTPVKAVTDNVFQPSKKTFFDKLLTPPRPTPLSSSASTGTSSAVAPPASTATSRVPAIFQTSSSSSPAPPATTTTKPPAPIAPSPPFAQTLLSKIPVEWQSPAVLGLLRRRPSQVVGTCVSAGPKSIWAIQALANLLCRSLQEDPYGVAQRDIPKILEAFVRYLVALENLAVALSLDAADDDERADVVHEVEAQVGPIKAALEEGVRAVLVEFGPYLDSFSFPPTIASRLDSLLPANDRP
ncbi:hypothetical protein RQP46_000809 [Phenoliferia psychrophenolica]